MSRRAFLFYAGGSLFTVTGIAGIITYLLNASDPKVTHGFGAGTFGEGDYGK